MQNPTSLNVNMSFSSIVAMVTMLEQKEGIKTSLRDSG